MSAGNFIVTVLFWHGLKKNMNISKILSKYLGGNIIGCKDKSSWY